MSSKQRAQHCEKPPVHCGYGQRLVSASMPASDSGMIASAMQNGGYQNMQCIRTTNDKAPLAGTNIKAPGVVNTVTIDVEFSGTPAELAQNPELLTFNVLPKVFHARTNKFDKGLVFSSTDERGGKGFFVSAQLLHAKNTFHHMPIGINISGIVGSSYGTGKESSYAFTLAPASEIGPRAIYEADPYINSAMMRTYGTCSEEAINDGIAECPHDPGMVMILGTNPVITNVLSKPENCIELGVTPEDVVPTKVLGRDDSGGVYLVETPIYTRILNEIRARAQGRVYEVDFSNISAQMERSDGRPLTDTTLVESNGLGTEDVAREMHQNRTGYAHATIELKFAHSR